MRGRARGGVAVAGALALALAVAGCAPGAGPDGAAAGPDVASAPVPADAELRAAAALAPCPVSDAEAADAGDRLPDLVLPCLGDGPEVALTGLTGAPTLVNLWASWCGPCVDELPALEAVDGRGGLRVLGVLTQDRERQGLAAAAGLGVGFPSVVDEQGRLLRALGLRGLPATVLVDAAGRVVHTYVGPPLDEPALAVLAAEHLGVAL